jgi:hypothetical protein
MSQEQSTIGSGTGGAPPPVSTPTPAPSSAPPPAAAQPAAPVGAVPAESAVESTQGASTPEKSTTYDQAREKLHAARDAAFKEDAQPEAESEGEPALSVEPKAPPVIAEPEVEPLAPEVEAVPAEAAAAPAEGEEAADLEDLKTVLTEDLLEQKYPRQMSKRLKADVAARETRRGQLEEAATVIGGDIGLGIAKAVLPIFLTDCPFDKVKQPAEAKAWWEKQTDTLLDQIVLPENAGAGELFEALSHNFVTTALYDEREGPGFASNLISEEWGKQPDGQTPYDLPFVDSLLKAHKSWGIDNGHTGMLDDDDKPIIDPARAGKPITVATIEKLIKADQAGLINHEFVDSELAGMGSKKAEPTARELELEAENTQLKTEGEATKTAREAVAAEAQRKREGEIGVYKNAAKGDISRAVMQDVLPIAESTGWAASKDDTPERAGRKNTLGRLVAADINAVLMGDPANPNEDWKKAWDMVERYEAYTSDGKRTPRFKKALEPLQIKAKAMFLGIQRDLNTEFSFTAKNSRNAQLAKKNGYKVGEQPVTPPVAMLQPSSEPKPTDPGYWEWRAGQAKSKLHAAREAAERASTVGQL